MRIAVLGIRGLPANYGGFEVTAENVVTRLVERGHHLTIYCRGGRKGKSKEFKGMKLIYLPSLELPHLSTPSHTTLAALNAIFHKYDAIFAFNVGNALQVLLMRIFGKKSVVFVDGLDWKRDKYGAFGKWFLRRSESLSAHVAAHIVVDAIPAQQHYKKVHGREVQYIPSGAEIIKSVKNTGIIEKLGLQPGRYATAIGRLTPEKRQDVIAKTFKRIDTDMKLVIVGGNPYDTDFVRRVEESAKNDERILVTGPIYGDEASELYFNAAVFVNASTIEGTSLSILQAMGNGCALLASDIVENVAAVHGAALHFKTDSMDDFAEKFQRILSDEKLREELSLKAKDVIKEFYSWDIAADKFEKLLLDAAGLK